NLKAIEAAGFSYIIAARFKDLPYPVWQWRQDHPGKDYEDGQVWRHVTPGSEKYGQHAQVEVWEYSTSRARKTNKGLDAQVAKAEDVVSGKRGVRKNRFVSLERTKKSVNTDLVEKVRSLAGLKGWVTNREDFSNEFVMSSYRRLLSIEASFRMSKSDLKARPVHHRDREKIEAHLTIVMTALAVVRWLEETTGWSIKKLVEEFRAHKLVVMEIAGQQVVAESPPPKEAARVAELVRQRAAGRGGRVH
ncbi:IS1634 family transposase, partial [Brevibacterium litoralis]|uniref:IS1634 family transposase n=1 Tax=Brevibacterium litoralis TaxID=3138935 RepID=UPI003D9A6D53